MKKLNVRIYTNNGIIEVKLQIPNIKTKEQSKDAVKQIINLLKKQFNNEKIESILVDYNKINKYSDMIYCNGKTIKDECLFIPTIKCETIYL